MKYVEQVLLNWYTLKVDQQYVRWGATVIYKKMKKAIWKRKFLI